MNNVKFLRKEILESFRNMIKKLRVSKKIELPILFAIAERRNFKVYFKITYSKSIVC